MKKDNSSSESSDSEDDKKKHKKHLTADEWQLTELRKRLGDQWHEMAKWIPGWKAQQIKKYFEDPHKTTCVPQVSPIEIISAEERVRREEVMIECGLRNFNKAKRGLTLKAH
jgi:hypothetical protein